MNGQDEGYLPWPLEIAVADDEDRWCQPESNISLDFHGDPSEARLVVFSDGNHHMALHQCISRFLGGTPAAKEVFYATTPPSVLLNIMDKGKIVLGNLSLSRQPHVFIGPENVLAALYEQGRVGAPRTFARSRGNVFLVRKGNPLGIRTVRDLLREDVRPFMSNPVRERASYEVYLESLLNSAEPACRKAIADRFRVESERVFFGHRIHHRELPQAIAAGRADVGVAYFHLALRYVRIFPELFEWSAFAGDPQQDRVGSGMVVTRYAVAEMRDPGEFGAAFTAFMQTPEAAQIYRSHGLVSPA